MSPVVAIDDFPNSFEARGNSCDHGIAVTKSDTDDLTHVSLGLFVGGAGDVKVNTKGGETITMVAVPAGSYIPLRVSRVWSTNTTATNIVALY